MGGPERADWDQEQVASTLEALRADYPGYTDNELYAIWCRDRDLIPVDLEGKVLVEEWQAHATHDGRHVQYGGFRMSRPLFGRARKAVRGAAKPAVVRRKREEIEAAEAMKGTRRGGPSERALSLAIRYDEADALLEEARPTFHQAARLKARLAEFGPAILAELARADFDTAELLRELGLLDRG
jgi:hypothetical protein